MLFKIFLFWSSGSPSVRCSRTIHAILKEGIIGNNHMKLYGIWPSDSGGDAGPLADSHEIKVFF